MCPSVDLVRKIFFYKKSNIRRKKLVVIVFFKEPAHHLFVTGLLPHEQYSSVLNIALNRTNDSEIIVKSKECLIFHVGFRRFSSSPIYSQHSN
ncbi:unnamed protein product [Rotaria sp. Silwood1]|nr:unnamed protein product [Rotaria sp. Silwood1]CAF1663853.1 unnamed protein product [Rotaria sp. Silwood1]CAF3676131.1 unnamed protein product [Rotaria sp. Silwood1]CAF3815579.1 unnamed protein product [Rotaria sp. Silwood1]CAF4742397.1 unnamed protein product [Rotaria sp. Silwood1]